MNGKAEEEEIGASMEHVFDQFVTAVTCKSILSSFNQLLDLTGLRHVDHAHFYEQLKLKLKGSWKAQSLWVKLDKRASHRDYKRGQACKNTRVLIIGSGPCGLRTAIECVLLGAKTVLVEKRDRFSRNNVLHLWPYLITDLRNLGAKKFFGKFCAGAIDHISIRQLQCILLKVALLLGVEVHVNVAFEELIEPPEDQSTGLGWRCRVTPENHALSEYVFDVLIGADGKRNTLPGFKRKEFRGKLAIAITANFINRNTQQEARVEEISGVAFIFNQKFFLDLKESTRIDLENIVYYKDDTHYFVMTAKKASLLEKGVLKEDHSDTIALLDRANVNQEALLNYAREAANFSTNNQLPFLEYAVNHYGQADVAMFDFTSMFAAENASRFVLKNGHHLLMGLVGDSLLEPFWPTGSGCARGFLGAFDAAWMIRNWAIGKSPLQVLIERESVFTVLSQTTPNYLHKNYNQYSIDPNTRYPNLNLKCIKPAQARMLYEGGVFVEEEEEDVAVVPSKKPRNVDESIDSYSLLRWCQRVLNTGKYRDVHVVDFTGSWRSGLALCALIHSFRPEIINNSMLMECEVAYNNQLAFNVAEKELGIVPVMTGEDMAKHEVPDKLTMVAYLSLFYELFKQEPLPSTMPLPVKSKRKSLARDQKPKTPHSPNKRASFLQKLSAKLAKSKKRKEQEENNPQDALNSKKLKEKEESLQKKEIELTRYSKLPMEEIANRLQLDRRMDDLEKAKVTKTNEEMMGAVSVTAMADLLAAKFKSYESQPAPEPVRRMKGQPALLAASSASEFCSFCHKRVYIMERMSAEGEFFHRGCFKCDHCSVGLRLTNYSCDRETTPVKFYCYRHALPEMRLRPQRKRGFEEEVKENIPATVIITPAPDVDQAPKEKSPRKNAPAHLAPLLIPDDAFERPKKTPERVEFEISFDGQEEESEEEQFEHNLRASLSSDTLLDDGDSDSDLSGSDIESGAEDEVWESAVDSLKTPGTPFTTEEARELVGTWRRQHSQENLADFDEGEALAAGRGYTRLQGDGDTWEDDGSSTEVEDGESDDESDASSEDASEEGNSERARGLSPDGQGGDSAKSPTSPLSRLSASKASFFSEPPTVVSLDPWSMFGMGNKGAPKEKRKKSVDTTSASKSVSRSQPSEESRKDDFSKDTDVSESLEFDFRSADEVLAKHSGDGSLENISELNPDSIGEQKTKGRNRNIGRAESIKEGEDENETFSRLVREGSEDMEDEDNFLETVKGSDGDDERDEKGEDDDDELMEKTAVSIAMEQLLLDIDQRSYTKDTTTENLLGETSDSAENELYIEGRHSPSASKTRKFRMKRHARRSKDQRRSSLMSTNSESEAGRTDPTTTDNSLPRSSMSRTPSVELEEVGIKIGNMSHSEKEKALIKTKEGSTAYVCAGEAVHPIHDKEQNEESISSHKLPVVSGNITLNNQNSGTASGTDSLQQILEDIAAMPDLSDNSDIDDLLYTNIDDKFVTHRRKKTGLEKVKPLKNRKGKRKDGKENEVALANSSFSISTPSDSESSVSSVEFSGLVMEIEPNEEDIKPDQDMLRDYQVTMSLALGESFSDEPVEELGQGKEGDSGRSAVDMPADKTSVPATVVDKNVDDSKASRNSSSFYATPNVSIENEESSTETCLSPVKKLPLLISGAPVPQPRKSILSPLSSHQHLPHSSRESTPTNAPSCPVPENPSEGNRDSSGSELFLSPVESFEPSPFPCTSPSTSHAAEKLKLESSSPPDKIASVKRSSTSQTPVKPKVSSEKTKPQRKLPELPKLKIQGKQPIQPKAAVEQPNMCSSPKSRFRTPPAPFPGPDGKRPTGRALPLPGEVRRSESGGKDSSTTGLPVKSTFDSNFAKPITPPVFKPPGRTVVPVDKTMLRLGSCSEPTDSESENKKKISAEGIIIENAIDDIPFADDSEIEEKFYTPCDPSKQEKPKFPAPDHLSNVRKRILPSPPSSHKSNPVVLSAEQIKEIRKTDREKAKMQARERARLKSDEELGLAMVNPVFNSPAKVLLRKQNSNTLDGDHSQTSTSNNTPSTSDVLTDSDDNKLSSVHKPLSTVAGDRSLPANSSKDKKKIKTPKPVKQKKVKENGEKESDPDKKEKRKSLLALILPSKIADKNSKVVTDSDNTPKGSDDNTKKKSRKKLKNKDRKKKDIKASDSHESLDKTPTSENKRDLAICSVFHSEVSNRPKKTTGGAEEKKVIPVAPKASVDEFSDSDESHVSFCTMQTRKTEDLDERVARRLRRIQLKQQRQAVQKRLRMAQEIQRQLEEVEVRQKELEERGIAVEKALRGDGPEDDIDEGQLMSEWFTLVHEKNALLRYESELNVRAKELELEDRQARLEMDFRERSRHPDKTGRAEPQRKKSEKSGGDIAMEGQLLDELLEVVEQRNTLVAMLDEDRLREQKEDNDLKEMMVQKGFVLSPLSYDTRRDRQKLEESQAPLAL